MLHWLWACILQVCLPETISLISRRFYIRIYNWTSIFSKRKKLMLKALRERETSWGECTWDLWVPFNSLASRSYKFARTEIILRRRFLRKRNIIETPRVLKYSTISVWCCMRPWNNMVIYINSMVKQNRITLHSLVNLC